MRLALGLCAAMCPLWAQLPASEKLSASDEPLFRAELARIEALLATAPDPAAVSFILARTWASAKQWPETVEWLNKAVAFRQGIDPSRDSLFAELHGTLEFSALLDAVREATPPVSTSRPAFRIGEGDLMPESMAYDPQPRRFYFGSMSKGKVIRCSASGKCAPFAAGLGTVLGMKVRGDGLWLLNNSDRESALMHFDANSGALIRKYSIVEPGHAFNDLAFAGGKIYFTDTRAGAVWELKDPASDLARVPGKFRFANGIAASSDGALLYVSTFPDGITVVDLKTGASTPIGRPADLCLASIDGLYVHRGTLIAIQNGPVTPRVVRMPLGPDARSIERFEILERRNPLFDGITTGVLVGDDFYYMANIQDGKKSNFNPIAILRIHL